jgi:hypothetical protein
LATARNNRQATCPVTAQLLYILPRSGLATTPKPTKMDLLDNENNEDEDELEESSELEDLPSIVDLPVSPDSGLVEIKQEPIE